MKAREFDIVIEKFGFSIRNARDKLAWFEHEGKTILHTKRSHARGDLPASNQIRQQLKLNEIQLKDAIACHFSLDDYIELLKEKGIIEKGKGRSE